MPKVTREKKSSKKQRKQTDKFELHLKETAEAVFIKTNKCKERFHRGRSVLDLIISIELWKFEWKFEKTRNYVETQAAVECFYRFFEFSQTFTRVLIDFYEVIVDSAFSLINYINS